MNVKQGDMAIQIISSAGNEGKIVEVLEYMGMAPVRYNNQLWRNAGDGPMWLVRYQNKVISKKGWKSDKMPSLDAWLRPVSGLEDSFEEESEKELENV